MASSESFWTHSYNILNLQITNLEIATLASFLGAFFAGSKAYNIIQKRRLHRYALKIAKHKKQQLEAEVLQSYRNSVPFYNSLDISQNKLVDPHKAEKILQSTATELLIGLEGNQFTSEEIVTCFNNQIRSHGYSHNAIADIDFERGLQLAKQRDAERWQGKIKGILHGLPITVKDSIPVAGLACYQGCGSRAFNVASQNQLIIEALESEGAIIYVKSAMSQAGLWIESHNNITGTILNPWDQSRSAGGSSGGESALISLRCSALGIGTDVGGSIRIPCLWTGLYGLKPSHNRISDMGPIGRYTGLNIATSWGPMARSVDDLNLVMNIVCGSNINRIDPEVPKLPWNNQAYQDNTKKLRIGYAINQEDLQTPACMQNAVLKVVRELESEGHELIPFTLPSLLECVHQLTTLLMCNEQAIIEHLQGEEFSGPCHVYNRIMMLPKFLRPAYARYLQNQGEKHLAALAWGLSCRTASQLDDIAKRQHQLRYNFVNQWQEKQLDALISPFGCPAPPNGQTASIIGLSAYCSMFNLLDFVAGAVPVSLVKEGEDVYHPNQSKSDKVMQNIMKGSRGLPVGVQVVTKPYNEELCLNVMKQIENRIPFKATPNVLGFQINQIWNQYKAMLEQYINSTQYLPGQSMCVKLMALIIEQETFNWLRVNGIVLIQNLTSTQKQLGNRSDSISSILKQINWIKKESNFNIKLKYLQKQPRPKLYKYPKIIYKLQLHYFSILQLLDSQPFKIITFTYPQAVFLRIQLQSVNLNVIVINAYNTDKLRTFQSIQR